MDWLSPRSLSQFFSGFEVNVALAEVQGELRHIVLWHKVREEGPVDRKEAGGVGGRWGWRAEKEPMEANLE